MTVPRVRQWLLVAILSVTALAAKCGGADTAELLSGGETESDSVGFRALDYEITSDNYKKWLLAQGALDSADVDPKLRVNPRRLTPADIDGVIETLEKDSVANRAIESAGLSARDYVLTTIALAQSWGAVNRPRPELRDIPADNVAWMRSHGAEDPVVQARSRARILADDDADSEDSDDSDRKSRGHLNDSDSDSHSDS